ncbi:MAG: hypothetical protein IPK19_41080 [Chloroflexi bacterium]|nr:hypothetical protein [Chloroflexota bacterium]
MAGAFLYIQLENFEAAIDHLLRYQKTLDTENDADDREIQRFIDRKLGDLYYFTRNFQLAVAQYQKSIKDKPGLNSEDYLRLGNCHLQMDQPSKALRKCFKSKDHGVSWRDEDTKAIPQ